jgi:hypothetical protein
MARSGCLALLQLCCAKPEVQKFKPCSHCPSRQQVLRGAVDLFHLQRQPGSAWYRRRRLDILKSWLLYCVKSPTALWVQLPCPLSSPSDIIERSLLGILTSLAIAYPQPNQTSQQCLKIDLDVCGSGIEISELMVAVSIIATYRHYPAPPLLKLPVRRTLFKRGLTDTFLRKFVV